jgi:hypothetical protein
MTETLHITSGDIAGESLIKSGIHGEIFVWHDIMYDGPRKPGWPDDDILLARASFLEKSTGGGLKKSYILKTLKEQYDTGGGYKMAPGTARSGNWAWSDGNISFEGNSFRLRKTLGYFQ